MFKDAGITTDSIRRFLDTVEAIPKPIEQLVRSKEGGEHLVWIINDAFVLRVRDDGQDDALLTRERDMWNLLKSTEPASPAIPTCLGIGLLNGESHRPYGLYRKLSGVSAEASPQSISRATEDHLALLMILLKHVPVEKARAIGVCDAEPVDLGELRGRALVAWQRLDGAGHVALLARGLDIAQALYLAESEAEETHAPVLLHADLKGEHVFVDAQTGCLTGVIDWSDACIGHPSVDIHGLAISIGAAAAARVAVRAGYGIGIVARGVFTARCESIICLDAILSGNDDSPEWLVRLQLQRALEGI